MSPPLEAHKPDAHESNLLQLIFRVIHGARLLNGDDLALGRILLPGTVSCGRGRFLSLLLPKQLLKRFKFGLFLSYSDEKKRNYQYRCVRGHR